MHKVNAAWAGLGYYRRARYLLEGARHVMREHGGEFPRTSKELQQIPGMQPLRDAQTPAHVIGTTAPLIMLLQMRSSST